MWVLANPCAFREGVWTRSVVEVGATVELQSLHRNARGTGAPMRSKGDPSTLATHVSPSQMRYDLRSRITQTSISRSLTLLCLGLWAAPAVLAQASLTTRNAQESSSVRDEHVVHFGGRKATLADLPESLSETARETIASWANWADGDQDGRYALTMDESARVLILARKSGSNLRSELKLVKDVLEWSDARFPAAALDAADVGRPGSTEGYTGGALPDHLPVLLLVDGDEDLGAVLEHLARLAPYLASWTTEARTQNGFVLPLPLVGAYLTKDKRLKEWSPEHELLNRLTRLLLLQRFGQQPEWISQGLAWEMEWDHAGSIWSYARREGFVYASEHDSWDDRLRRAFSDRKDKPLTASELCALDRGGFEADAALVAWGASAFLARHHASELGQVLSLLAADRKAGARKDLGNGRWTLVPDYVTPPEKQVQILRDVLGPDVLSQMVASFVKGKSYRP